MGNSGWCMSKNKEVEYRAGEAYRSRSSELMSDKGNEKENAIIDALMNEMTLKIANKCSMDNTTPDKKAREVSNSVKNKITNKFSLLGTVIGILIKKKV